MEIIAHIRSGHVERHLLAPENLVFGAKGQDGKAAGEIDMFELLRAALRQRPQYLMVGEVRGKEAQTLFQAMNTGHEGSLTTAHSNSPRDTLSRLEVMCLMAGMDLPVRAIREQVASAIELIVHQERMRDGTRKVVNITEVQGMEGAVIVMQDIFRYMQTGVQNGRVQGHFTATGIRPKFMDKIEAAGIELSPALFSPAQKQRRR